MIKIYKDGIKEITTYPSAIDTGNIIFISGQIGIPLKKNKQTFNSISCQTKQALIKIKKILKKINLRVDHIAKVTLFITDINELTTINSAYKTFFQRNNAPLPARSCIEVSNLPKNAGIEIDAIAIRQNI
ncbi:reactive intermediate/imine deaminase [Blochmannia endosymbiont of Colobopsis nipponica]|uniref:Rid family detoxifying hydrolase n=1 Tax=Blochmannia endosymbiont of Colobopsis nipponica TaxID=2681987 RepID=UPI0017817F1D|nr:Rid family detoxifying hydrolase [Blochmannia endosymbiont of Colobopsis nipponica]QOI10815.1 reactive intermediate/imine deaminase [Blochmannia endosymbiont of Colobopsis nipponica]